MSDRSTGLAPSKLTAVLGPTNTGKTHLAVERMMAHGSGMIGLPLRLLAREIYDRIVKLRGKASVALITGEEKIVPARANYFVCTVEAMPLGREVEFLAVDEIQLCADPERGHIFTHRLLHARGKFETMFLGAGTMAPLVRRLLPDAEIVGRERFSNLSYAGSKKLTRLPRRTAIVAFSTDAVYAIAELIRRQRGGAAVVMGSLSPRTRNAQVALYQSGEVDFLVATDAIGMGLNMDVDHVAFAGLRKFDGKRTRWLYPQEVGQIAGRAGRYTRDGTFGVTSDCEEIDEDLVEAVESHTFEPIQAAEWRNARLDFGSLPGLLRSLSETPKRNGLSLSQEALDERTLRALAKQEDVVARCKTDRSALLKLWDVCQTPDFRKTTDDEHQRMARTLFDDLTTGRKRLPEDWVGGQFKALDRTDGEIDSLAARLSGVRTLSYIANRPDWVGNPAHWQGLTRQLEDRISDTLHEKLMARFIDRRTSVLMKQLGERETLYAGVGQDGEVTVEGHVVGHLSGVAFTPVKATSALEEKALRNAAQRAVGPEIARRLGVMASEADDAFALTPDGAILWRGEAAGAVRRDLPLLSPRARLLGELGHAAARERAERRLDAFLAGEVDRYLAPLRKLERALVGGELRGLPRGISHRLLEAGGVLDKRPVDPELKALSQGERRTLKSLGVRIGAFSLYCPGVLKAEAIACARALNPTGWRGALTTLEPLPSPEPSLRELSASGLRAVAGYTTPVEALEILDALLRADQQLGGVVLTDQALEKLGWTAKQASNILRALDYTPAIRAKPDQPIVWKRRGAAKLEQKPVKARPDSPFAALAKLTEPPPPPARRKRPRRKKPAAPKAAAS
ncbi:helicase-related protein [Caulobacter sp. RHG1]|uniref:helicase-related protein n=1 Tax=Caulobacter sp. (strain RHG1) TaxID=2545762 RepID=UPI00155406E6|nr:helicase-related protein [Caulobacter sp. RHG1]NQE63678.1 ATP-dependent DNA helicase [Caulobacter sp. RHG1]